MILLDYLEVYSKPRVESRLGNIGNTNVMWVEEDRILSSMKRAPNVSKTLKGSVFVQTGLILLIDLAMMWKSRDESRWVYYSEPGSYLSCASRSRCYSLLGSDLTIAAMTTYTRVNMEGLWQWYRTLTTTRQQSKGERQQDWWEWWQRWLARWDEAKMKAGHRS